MKKNVRFNVGEYVITPRGYVGKITSLHDLEANVEYVGMHKRHGSVALNITLLRSPNLRELQAAGFDA